MTGFWSSIFITSAGTNCFSTTRRNIYSSNHSSVMMMLPWKPEVAPQLFSTIHFCGTPSFRSTAMRVIACEEPLACVITRSRLSMDRSTPSRDS